VFRKMRMIFAETERYDGEIVAAELERGCAEQHAESAGDSGTQGENDQNGR